MNISHSLNNLFKILQFSKKKDKQDSKVSRKPGYVSSKIINITTILKTCDGRDKLCAFIQYTSKFYSTILYHIADLDYNSFTVEDPFKQHYALKNIEKSMSNGRKIFRFLKWIEDIKEIYYHVIYKDTSIRNLFKAIMCMASMFYNIFDNFVWCSNVGVMSEFLVGDIKLKNIKNIFSLLRNLIKITMDVFKFQELYEANFINEEEVYEAFEKSVENFDTDANANMLMQTIQTRKKMRNKVLDIVHSFLRCCMLVYSLKLDPFYSNLHPIFTGMCGMLHSILALYKDYIESEDTQKLSSKTKLEMNGTKKSLEDIIYESEEPCEETILKEEYFNQYYVDFNKDFPIDPKDTLGIKFTS